MLADYGSRNRQGFELTKLKYFNISSANLSDIPQASPIYIFNEYWSSIKPNGRLPSRRDLDPTEIPRIISWLFLVDIKGTDRKRFDFVFRLIGTSNANLVGKDVTGQRVTDAFEPAAARVIIGHYTKTVDTRKPTFWKTEVPTAERRYVRCFRGVFPLSSDGERVDMLAGMLVPVSEMVHS